MSEFLWVYFLNFLSLITKRRPTIKCETSGVIHVCLEEGKKTEDSIFFFNLWLVRQFNVEGRKRERGWTTGQGKTQLVTGFRNASVNRNLANGKRGVTHCCAHRNATQELQSCYRWWEHRVGHVCGKRRTEMEREISYCFTEEGKQKRAPLKSKTDRFLLIEPLILPHVGTTLDEQPWPRLSLLQSHLIVQCFIKYFTVTKLAMAQNKVILTDPCKAVRALLLSDIKVHTIKLILNESKIWSSVCPVAITRQ